MVALCKQYSDFIYIYVLQYIPKIVCVANVLRCAKVLLINVILVDLRKRNFWNLLDDSTCRG